MSHTVLVKTYLNFWLKHIGPWNALCFTFIHNFVVIFLRIEDRNLCYSPGIAVLIDWNTLNLDCFWKLQLCIWIRVKTGNVQPYQNQSVCVCIWYLQILFVPCRGRGPAEDTVRIHWINIRSTLHLISWITVHEAMKQIRHGERSCLRALFSHTYHESGIATQHCKHTCRAHINYLVLLYWEENDSTLDTYCSFVCSHLEPVIITASIWQ